MKTCKADLSEANLKRADLSGAHRHLAVLVETNLENAVLTGCRVYAISVTLERGEGDQEG